MKSIPTLRKISKNFKIGKKCPYIALPESNACFMNSLDPQFRKDLRRNSKHLKRDFTVRFCDYSEPTLYADGMKIFFKLHQKRWASKGFPGAFADEKFRSFHLEIAKIFSESGWLGLFIITLSGEPAAVSYGFKYKRKYYYYLSGFDPKFSRYSVGNGDSF